MSKPLTTDEFSAWYNKLPILAYGELDDKELLDYFTLILKWKSERIFISTDKDIPNQLFSTLEYWLLLGLLADCIDYGSSPRGAWLTDFGTSLLEFLTAGNHLEYIEGLYYGQ
jgi:hypothetical protein